MSGEKRSQDCEDTLLAETAIIVDIEGTTTSISFVKETLFPYVRENLKKYIEKNWEVAEFKGDLEKLKEQAKKDEADKIEGVVSITGAKPEEERESVVKNVLWQMDGDRKSGALKQLQGHMWREAYESGTVKGHVYEDVPKAFDAWTKSGRKIYVYSSGSVDAQKLLFGHSVHGDMLKYFSDYFDTEVGAKQEVSSYKNILTKIGAEPSSVLFLTDIVKEAQAAKDAGLTANIVIRPGNTPLTDEEKVTFTTIESFTDLSFQSSAKRQKVENTEEKLAAAEPKVTDKSEPMDTSEEASAEPTTEKTTEKIDDAKKTLETTKVEETKISEKSEVISMDTDSKVETEKKTAKVVDKPVEVVESKKNEEESKNSEKSSEVIAATVTSDGEVACAKKVNEAVCAKKESEAGCAKKESEAVCAKKENEVVALKKESEAVCTKKEGEAICMKKESEASCTKKETEATCTKKETEATCPKKESAVATCTKTENEATKTEADSVVSEPMDKDKIDLPSKSEPIATITEAKTEVTAKSAETAKSEKKIETEGKTVETVPDSKITANDDATVASSVTEESSTVVVESKIAEKKSKEDKVETTSVEKTESEVVEDTPVKMAAKADEKPAKEVEPVKQNGDTAAPKIDEAKPADKAESNCDTKVEAVKTVEAAPEIKVAPVAQETEKKTDPPVVESANKEEKQQETEKTKIDEKPTDDNDEGKLNGTSEKEKDEKPHRNGLNGESTSSSSTEKTNGDTKEEPQTSAQNGDLESSTGSAESIKTKKVVDSTIADGAGEPDVVPPVAVAATS